MAWHCLTTCVTEGGWGNLGAGELADENAHRLAIQQQCDLQSLRCPILCLALSLVASGDLTSNGVQPESETGGTVLGVAVWL